MNRKLIGFLILFDLAWSISALIYDGGIITKIPFYFWPFLIICPIFPFILALAWYQIYYKIKPSPWFLAFGGISSAIYFLAALIYYPAWMYINGFDILALGQIFWIAAYATQAFYLMKKFKLETAPILTTTIFLVLSFLTQWQTKTLGYLDFINMPSAVIAKGYILLVIILFTLSTFLISRGSRQT